MIKKNSKAIEGTIPLRHFVKVAIFMPPIKKTTSGTQFEIISDIPFCHLSIEIYTFPENLSNLAFRKYFSSLREICTLPANLKLTPPKSGYLAIEGIEDFRLKESNA
jgi:hypothetical protein